MTRTPRVRAGCIACFLLLSIASEPASPTTITDFTLADLVRFSHACVRATPVEVVTGSGHLTTYRLDITEAIYGLNDTAELSLTLPEAVQGMPRLQAGTEYVLFLNFQNRFEKIIGLRWGTYLLLSEQLHSYTGQPLALVPLGEAGAASISDSHLRAVDPSSQAAPLLYAEFKAEALRLRDQMIAAGFEPLAWLPAN